MRFISRQPSVPLVRKGLRENNISLFITAALVFCLFGIKDISVTCAWFVNQDDDAAFLRVITPRNGIGPNTLKSSAPMQRAAYQPVCASTDSPEQRLSEKAMQRLKNSRRWVIDTADRIERADNLRVIEQFIDQISYPQHLQEESKTRNRPTAR